MLNPLAVIRSFFIAHTTAPLASAENAVTALEGHVRAEVEAVEQRFESRLAALEAKAGITPAPVVETPLASAA